jgi:hypothetical protein
VRDRPDQINFNKRHKAAELIQQIQLHQSTPYNLADVLPIQQYLEAAFRTSRDNDNERKRDMFDAMSAHLEPKERDDDRIARRTSAFASRDARA